MDLGLHRLMDLLPTERVFLRLFDYFSFHLLCSFLLTCVNLRFQILWWQYGSHTCQVNLFPQVWVSVCFQVQAVQH